MIDDLDDLLETLAILDVEVKYENLHARDPRLEGYADPSKHLISLDISLLSRPIDYVCILGEETGHVLRPPIHNLVSYHLSSYWQMDALQKSELKYRYSKEHKPALTWASNYFILDAAFLDFIKSGPREKWEFIERFEVTEWILMWKIGIIRTKQRLPGRNVFKRPLISGFVISE